MSNIKTCRIFVVAGNYAEFTHFLRDQMVSHTDFKYISSKVMLRGNVYPIIFIGTYRNREDIDELMDEIKMLAKFK
jgi:hypothetical protein